jgi:hypothetical protein
VSDRPLLAAVAELIVAVIFELAFKALIAACIAAIVVVELIVSNASDLTMKVISVLLFAKTPLPNTLTPWFSIACLHNSKPPVLADANGKVVSLFIAEM